jgi:hypothetical protein
LHQSPALLLVSSHLSFDDQPEALFQSEALGLTEEEVAFYNALETNDSAVKVLGDETPRAISHGSV